MTASTERVSLGVNRDSLVLYLIATHLVSALLLGGCIVLFVGPLLHVAFPKVLAVTGIAAILYAAIPGLLLAQRQAAAIEYCLDGTTLRVNEGILFLSRKAIPLDRVTDIALVQGPVLRVCGIWALRIQTAGRGSEKAEATLYALRNPESVRDQILVVRDRATQA